MKVRIITIDGPSGVGKGTLAKKIAAVYGYHVLASGMLYRAVALIAQQRQCFDVEQLLPHLHQLDLCWQQQRYILNGEDVHGALTTEQTAKNASKLSSDRRIRAALVQRQRDFAKPPGLVAEGRDMGTIVFADAQIKIYLTASVACRAQRRAAQLQDGDIQAITQLMIERDRRDTQRSQAPLKPAGDAVIINTSALSFQQVFEKTQGIIQGEL